MEATRLRNHSDAVAGLADKCREGVRDRPLGALGIALAAGALLSYLLNRR